jgi:conjugal transfer pilus assembly protein TraV
MRSELLCLLSILVAWLTGCSTINSNFSCNATAGDSCLTIEQVDAMTRFADEIKPIKRSFIVMKAENNSPNTLGKLIKQNNGQSLWVARNLERQSWA